MKYLIRIDGLGIGEPEYVYWEIYVIKEVIKLVKRIASSSGVLHFPVYYTHAANRGRHRTDYILVSCTESSWDKISREVFGRYLCTNLLFFHHKKGSYAVRTEVVGWKLEEIENINFPTLIFVREGNRKEAIFDIRDNNLFYQSIIKFNILLFDDYQKNRELGSWCLGAEWLYKEGFKGRWLKRRKWNLVEGNYKGES